MNLVGLQKIGIADRAPRYEFRIWGRDLNTLFNLLRSLSDLTEIEDCTDSYVIPRRATAFSAKIRGDVLTVKQLVEERRPLERWRPHSKRDFPMSAHAVHGDVLPLLGLEAGRPPPGQYDVGTFVRRIVNASPELRLVPVRKTRYLFSIGSCRAEYTVTSIGSAMLDTVAVEAEEVAPVLRAIAQLGVRRHENVSYPQALRKLLGVGPTTAEA